jgi:hypothetical protein
MIFHKFDHIIRPGFMTIAPLSSAQQFINSSAQLAIKASGGPSRNGYETWLHLTSFRDPDLSQKNFSGGPGIIGSSKNCRKIKKLNSEQFARHPVLPAQPQKFVLHQIL